MDGFVTVAGETTAEYTEKRSRFIATLCPCDTEEKAAEFINKMRSEYWDARHNCFAYSVGGGAVKRFSDDGEPHGTAGKPILEVIEGAGITNTVIVVTRYFGGVLLGTGGLVRAYTKAAKDAVDLSERVLMTPCTVFSCSCSYSDRERLVKLIEDCGGTLEDTLYTAEVELKFYISKEKSEQFLKKLCETFSARLSAQITGTRLCPVRLWGELYEKKTP